MLFLLRIKFCIATDKLLLNVAKLLFCVNKKEPLLLNHTVALTGEKDFK